MNLLSQDSILKFWAFWITLGILVPVIVYMTMVDHDQFVETDKVHKEWLGAWTNGINQLDSCQPFLTSMYDDEKDKWLHSELWPIIEKRWSDLHC